MNWKRKKQFKKALQVEPLAILIQYKQRIEVRQKYLKELERRRKEDGRT